MRGKAILPYKVNYIIIFHCKNDRICLIILHVFHFSLQVLDKLDFWVLEFWLFSELAHLDWYLTWRIKYKIIPVCTDFHWNRFNICTQVVITLTDYVLYAQISAQMVLYICIFFVPVIREVARYLKVYLCFTIFFSNRVQYWEFITLITVHEFMLFILDAVHDIFPGFSYWGDFILRKIYNLFYVCLAQPRKNENHNLCLTPRFLKRCRSESILYWGVYINIL